MNWEDLTKDELIDILWIADRIGAGPYLEKAEAQFTEEKNKKAKAYLERKAELSKAYEEAYARYTAAYDSLASKYGGALIEAPADDIKAANAMYHEAMTIRGEIQHLENHWNMEHGGTFYEEK